MIHGNSSQVEHQRTRTYAVLPTNVFHNVVCIQLRTGTRRVSLGGTDPEALVAVADRKALDPLDVMEAVSASRRLSKANSRVPT